MLAFIPVHMQLSCKVATTPNEALHTCMDCSSDLNIVTSICLSLVFFIRTRGEPGNEATILPHSKHCSAELPLRLGLIPAALGA